MKGIARVLEKIETWAWACERRARARLNKRGWSWMRLGDPPGSQGEMRFWRCADCLYTPASWRGAHERRQSHLCSITGRLACSVGLHLWRDYFAIRSIGCWSWTTTFGSECDRCGKHVEAWKAF